MNRKRLYGDTVVANFFMDKQTKWMVLGVVAILIVVLGIAVVRPLLQKQTPSEVALVNEIVERPVINFEFTYQSGEEGYRFIEPVLGGSTTVEGLEAVFIMVKTKAYADYQNATPGGEAPPSMSIFVFAETGTSTGVVGTTTVELSRLERIKNWAQVHDGYTSYSRAEKEPEVVRIDGVNTLHYRADGLYPQDIYIALSRERYYLIVGQYDGEADSAYSAFQKLIASIGFM